PAFVTDLVAADKELDVAGPILNVDEPQLAGIALQDNAPGGANLRSSEFAFAVVGLPLLAIKILVGEVGWQFDARAAFRLIEDFASASAQVANERAIVEATAPRIVTEFDDPRQLRAARRFKTGAISNWRGRIVRSVRHGVRGRKAC